MTPVNRLIALVTLAAAASVAAEVVVDTSLPTYQRTQGVSGSITSIGSDTMNNLMTLWAEKFNELYPNVNIGIEGKGSSTAPPALIEGQANFGPMSREMKEKEVDAFEEAYDYKPTSLRTAIDMLAVYVHKDNPIAKTGLSLQQIDAIFSSTRKGGHEKDVVTWGDAGLTGEWADKPISIYGRNSASGTYGYFKSKALFKGDFKNSVKEQPGSAAVVQGVASDRYGIGYSGIGYRTADVAIVPLAKSEDHDFVSASPDQVRAYPLARYLYIYINYRPGSELEPLRAEYLKLVYSREGQEVAVKDGYLPVPFKVASKDLGEIGITLSPKK